jgi:signal transduction histidine kinase
VRGQITFFTIIVVAATTLAWRRERLELRGRAQQQRLVDAAEAERRRIERNIHDGAQQQLVAIGVKLGVATSLVSKDPGQAEALLRTLRAEVDDTLAGLRDMARGTYPPILADRGLAAAIAQQAAKAPMQVDVAADGVGRLPKDVETAAYFCCLEALQNAAKHAGTDRLSVRLWIVGRTLAFTVVDDGRGFDTAVMRRGVGTRSMVERIEALGGSLEIRSSVGHGTTIHRRVPL